MSQDFKPPRYSDEPEFNPSSSYGSYTARERGGCLTAWIVVSALASVYAIFLFFQILQLVSENPILQERIPGFYLLALGGLIVVSIVGLWGIWNWKKWGVYLLVFTSLASAALEFMMGIATSTDIIQPVIQIGLLAWLVSSRWEYFE